MSFATPVNLFLVCSQEREDGRNERTSARDSRLLLISSSSSVFPSRSLTSDPKKTPSYPQPSNSNPPRLIRIQSHRCSSSSSPLHHHFLLHLLSLPPQPPSMPHSHQHPPLPPFLHPPSLEVLPLESCDLWVRWEGRGGDGEGGVEA